MPQKLLCCFPVLYFLALTALYSYAQQQASTKSISAKDAMAWLQRSNEQTNLRLPGSAPFHLKIKFHAFPGMEMLPPKQAEILTGDGIYEETWLEPHRWRREVTLGSYHAIETESNHVRKMQASEDYIPSRVFMLMTALLNSVSSYNLATYFQDENKWYMLKSTSGELSAVKIFAPVRRGPQLSVDTAYIFSSDGILMQSHEWNVVTTWDDDHVFAGKVVPGHILIQADAERNLVTADLSIEPAGTVDPTMLDLSTGRADPGMTLRPFQSWEIKIPQRRESKPIIPSDMTQSQIPDILVRINFTRTGKRRDVEVISIPPLLRRDPLVGASSILAAIRDSRYIPATTDGNPCQTAWNQSLVP
jgi:hypothetical protein